MYRVKICGITTPADALLAAAAGADAIGLNFFSGSPRCVDTERAGQIIERLRQDYAPSQVQVFGVFVNATVDEILRTIRAAKLDGVEQGFGIQLHGDEPPELLRELQQIPIVRALRPIGGSLARTTEYLAACQLLDCLPEAVLLDAHSPAAYGGTGLKLNWAQLASRGDSLLELPLVLAGGLNPENVAAAISTARPHAVDVASGVETSPGIKDAAKVTAFISAAKNAFVPGGTP